MLQSMQVQHLRYDGFDLCNPRSQTAANALPNSPDLSLGWQVTGCYKRFALIG